MSHFKQGEYTVFGAMSKILKDISIHHPKVSRRTTNTWRKEILEFVYDVI